MLYCISVSTVFILFGCFSCVSSHQHHDGAKVGGSQQHLQVFGHLKHKMTQTERTMNRQLIGLIFVVFALVVSGYTASVLISLGSLLF